MRVTSFTRKRRRSGYAGIVAVGLLLGLCAGFVTLWNLGSERIAHYAVDVAVQADGTALVRETIDYDFGREEKHGIFRDFPGYRFDGDQRVSDVRVWSASAPADVDLSDTGAAEIRIGDPNSTVSGRHRYVIQYRTTGATSGDRLAFDVVGTGWDVPIHSVDIHLTAPYRLGEVRCFRGYESGTNRCETLSAGGDAVSAHVEDLEPEQGVTIDGRRSGALSGQARTGFASAPELTDGRPYGRTILLVLGFGTLGFALGATLAVWWVRRLGRDRAWAGGGIDAVFGGPGLDSAPIADTTAEQQVTVQFEPPRDLTPAQGGVLLTEKVERHHQVAWLIQQSLDGRLEIDGRTLRWTGGGDRKSAPKPLQRMFGTRTKVSLAKFDKAFAAGFGMVGEDLRKWRSAGELWDHPAEKRNRTRTRGVVVLGGLAVVAGLVILIVATSATPVAAYAGAGVSAFLAGAGVGVLFSGRELPVRTPRGFAYRQLVEGFRRFLAASEGRHARAAAERDELRLYSAWAVALGELDRWNAAMKSASLPPETPGVGDMPTYVLLDSSVHTATSAPSTSSSSSGSSSGSSYSGGGFSGGGDVGGGGGGGGGGSW